MAGLQQDLRIIKAILGAATLEETQAVEKNLKKKEEEQKTKVKEVKKIKEINKVGKKASLVAKAEQEQKERLTTMTEKEKEAMKTIQEVATKIQDPQSKQEQIATYAYRLASAMEEKSKGVWIRQWGNSEKEVREEGTSKTWTMVGGNLGRYINIVTMHHQEVPTDVNTAKVKWAINKANECLKKTITDTSQSHPPWQVLRIEPVSQISVREMR